MALTAAERAKRYRENNTIVRIGMSEQELEKLNEITEFYGWPNQSLDNSQTVQLMIHRFHKEVEKQRKALGACSHCGEALPAGCAKLKQGGLFKGDANCFHTTNRLSITNLSLEVNNECN
ncbi:hypothetical protein [Methylophaga sp.]|uniref:hypothetical protein n=1 Tax=Methylophaga sp. TaxID=2024840 RepID=UPI003A94B62B